MTREEQHAAVDTLVDAARALLSHTAPQAEPNLRALLNDALDRMDRARHVLTNGNPRPECNWGVLDTSAARTQLAGSPVSAPAPTCQHKNTDCVYESDDGEFERHVCRDCGLRFGREIPQ
jgi:hypothetical protein